MGFRQRLRLPALDAAVLLGCIAYGAALAAHTPPAVGGSDSSGYLNLAVGLASDIVVVPVPGLDDLGLGAEWARTFVPLGFQMSDRSLDLVPFYPPGFPLLLAAAGEILGWERGPFVVPGLFAGLGLFLLYLLGRVLGLAPWMAAGCAAALAAWPPFLHFGVQLMGDSVATTWTIGAMLLAFLARRHDSVAAAAGCGAVFVFSVVIRPTNGLLAPALAILLLPSWRLVLPFLLGGVPVGVPWLLYNDAVYGHPLRIGYSNVLAGDLAWDHFPSRFAHYGRWMIATLPLGLVSLVALPFARAANNRTVWALLAWFAAYPAFFCFYGPYEWWWYLRFLAPGVPAAILAMGLTLQTVFERRPTMVRQTVAGLGIALTVLLGAWQCQRLGVVASVSPQLVFTEGTGWLRRIEPRALVASMQFSGAIRYYAEQIPIRYDTLDAPRFEALRSLADIAGYRMYALVENWEREALGQAMPADWSRIERALGVSLFELPPRPPLRAAGVDQSGLAEIIAGIDRLPAESRGRLQRQTRAAFRSLVRGEHNEAQATLKTLQETLAGLRGDSAIERAVRRVALWQYLAGRDVSLSSRRSAGAPRDQ